MNTDNEWVRAAIEIHARTQAFFEGRLTEYLAERDGVTIEEVRARSARMSAEFDADWEAAYGPEAKPSNDNGGESIPA